MVLRPGTRPIVWIDFVRSYNSLTFSAVPVQAHYSETVRILKDYLIW